MAEAKSCYARALKILKAAVGPDDIRVISCHSHLGLLYRDQCKYAPAESIFKQTLAQFEQELGPTHPVVIASVENLAMLYKDWGRPRQAAEYERRRP